MVAIPLLAIALSAALESATIGSDFWTAASPAGVLATHEPMRGLVHRLDSEGHARLVIRHASDEADRQRAIAMHSALIALGVPSARLSLEPAAAPPGLLIVELHRSTPSP